MSKFTRAVKRSSGHKEPIESVLGLHSCLNMREKTIFSTFEDHRGPKRTMLRSRTRNACLRPLTWITNTGGPRYSRTFYPRFRLFAVQENIPKFTIRGLSLAHSWFIEEIRLKNDVKITFSSIQCSLVIRGFSIRRNLMKRI